MSKWRLLSEARYRHRLDTSANNLALGDCGVSNLRTPDSIIYTPISGIEKVAYSSSVRNTEKKETESIKPKSKFGNLAYDSPKKFGMKSQRVIFSSEPASPSQGSPFICRNPFESQKVSQTPEDINIKGSLLNKPKSIGWNRRDRVRSSSQVKNYRKKQSKDEEGRFHSNNSLDGINWKEKIESKMLIKKALELREILAVDITQPEEEGKIGKVPEPNEVLSSKLVQRVSSTESQEGDSTADISKKFIISVKNTSNGRTSSRGVYIKAQLDLAFSKFDKKLVYPQEERTSLEKTQVIPKKKYSINTQKQGHTSDSARLFRKNRNKTSLKERSLKKEHIPHNSSNLNKLVQKIPNEIKSKKDLQTSKPNSKSGILLLGHVYRSLRKQYHQILNFNIHKLLFI